MIVLLAAAVYLRCMLTANRKFAIVNVSLLQLPLMGLCSPCAPRGPGEMSGEVHSDCGWWWSLSCEGTRGEAMASCPKCTASNAGCGSMLVRSAGWLYSGGGCTATTMVRCLLCGRIFKVWVVAWNVTSLFACSDG